MINIFPKNQEHNAKKKKTKKIKKKKNKISKKKKIKVSEKNLKKKIYASGSDENPKFKKIEKTSQKKKI
ncbi:MAG: hypothetical protein CM15mV89_0010 [Caudoviricetes sp.]|nr:MAG: hypothetical protein CM15mV89_0010 [Caudoviricetes sp.]